jgi:drug/metabolite transporter (DMT)-like permease
MDIPTLPAAFWLPAVFTMLINLCVQYLTAEASVQEDGDVSVTTPMESLTPIWVLMLSAEMPSGWGWVGILLTVVGTYFLFPRRNMGFGWLRYFAPTDHEPLPKEIGVTTPPASLLNNPTILALLSSVLGSVTVVLDSRYVRAANGLQGVTIGLIILAFGIALCYGNITNFDRPPISSRHWVWIGSYAVLFAAGAWLVQPALAYTLATYVVSLKKIQVFIAPVLGFLILGEKNMGIRLPATLLIVLGSVFISWSAK